MNAAMENSEATVPMADLLARATSGVAHPSKSQAKLLDQLERLRERLATERFQLAVLGQFKRGKSTLLNALLRDPVLPTGVVPVTAIPTFIQRAKSPRLRVTYSAGRVEENDLAGGEELRARLRKLVTEEGNPRNVLEVARVDVFLPSRLLDRGVVLIDTPGVGSTHRHNSATADAVLPECDATLFVVSLDPPITQVEIEYLARIRPTVAHLTIVVNKIDTLEPEERMAAVAFLRRVLVEEAGLNGATPLFCISARGALRASEDGDQDALAASGFPELEAHLIEFLAHKKQATLAAAIARKASALVHELRLETEIALKSLRLPMQELEQRIRTFDEAAARFETQRQAAGDLLAGDRIRALQELQADAERLRQEGRAAFEQELDRALGGGADSETARATLAKTVVAFFDTALAEVVRTVGERVATMFSAHQERADELINLVRQTAADLLEIPLLAQARTDRFEPRRDPFWVTTARTVTLSPIPPGAFDRFLPQSMRKRRLRQRLMEEVDSVLRRNVENLRWATRQNLEDAFRRFGAELDERLASSLDATRGAMQAALVRRGEHSEAVEAEIAERIASSAKLHQIASDLVPFQ
jgi:GTP-binding protein EngB required for normal cell division